MKKINVEELKEIQLDILDCVSDFCKKNKIKFWLESGTLLGAIRHDGFIPWDDDIDIGMLREDYDQFMKEFKGNDKYKFMCYEIDKDSYVAFGKVIDTSTLLYEPNKKNGFATSVYIDVFVFDNAPDDEKEIKRMFNKRDFYKRLHSLQSTKSFYTPNKMKYNFIRYPFYFLLNLFPKRFFIKKIIDVSKKYSRIKSSYAGNFMGMYRFTFNKKLVSKTIEHTFEGKKYPIPVGYDELLTIEYGNYMELPPVEKRKSHHEFEAYIIDKK